MHKTAFVRFYRFFNRFEWCIDKVFECLAKLIVKTLLKAGALISLAVDDTVCRKKGLGMFGAGMHHDPLLSSKGMKIMSWGHDWVVVSIVVHGFTWAPDLAFSLPIGFRLYRNKQGLTKGQKKNKRAAKKSSAKGKRKPAAKTPANHKTRPELAVELLQLIAGWFPERSFVVTGDSLYGGKSVAGQLPENMDLISRTSPKAALYERAPALTGKRGRPRKKGDRLPTLDEWAADDGHRWTTTKFDTYGLHATLRWKRREALYYGVTGSRLVSVILVKDVSGKRGRQTFFCTNTNWSLSFILATYARRWSIEVTFENMKQHLGFSDAANRKEKAVRRTAPMAGLLFSLIVLWFNKHGHERVEFPDRPWYRRKQFPSFADMLTTLRRMSWEEMSGGADCEPGTNKKILTRLISFVSLAG